MSSDVDIMNLMLAHLGQDPTAGPLDPNTTRVPVRKLLDFLPMARDMVLQEFDWVEATQPCQMVPVSLSGYDPYCYAYGLPEDFLRVGKGGFRCGGRGTFIAGVQDAYSGGWQDGAGGPQWRLGTHLDAQGNRRRVIYATGILGPGDIVVRLPYDQLSPQLALMVSLYGALLGCGGVTGKLDRIDGLQRQYDRLSLTARTIDNFSSSEDPMPGPHLQSARMLAL